MRRKIGGWGALLLVAGLVGCEATEDSAVEVLEEEAVMEMPDVNESAALEAWLRGEGEGQEVRLPLWVELSALGVSQARVGSATGVVVRADDSRLGMGLADRARLYCDAEEEACVVWARARVGAEGPGLALPGAEEGPVVLTLLAVEGPAD